MSQVLLSLSVLCYWRLPAPSASVPPTARYVTALSQKVPKRFRCRFRPVDRLSYRALAIGCLSKGRKRFQPGVPPIILGDGEKRFEPGKLGGPALGERPIPQLRSGCVPR